MPNNVFFALLTPMFHQNVKKEADCHEKPESASSLIAASRLKETIGKSGRSIMAGATLLVATGCATIQTPAVDSEAKAYELAMAAQIDAAIARVSDQPRWSSSLDDRASFASFNTDAVSVSYQGSAAELLKAIAASRGISFKITGPAPHIPIFVFAETQGQPFEDFLRDLNKQFGQRADIVWTDTAFELRYR